MPGAGQPRVCMPMIIFCMARLTSVPERPTRTMKQSSYHTIDLDPDFAPAQPGRVMLGSSQCEAVDENQRSAQSSR
jgi:hypothetical protein